MFSTYLILIVAILNLLLGVFVFLKARNRVQKMFSYIIFLAFIWVATNFIYYLIPQYPFINITYATGALLAIGIYMWILVYSKKKVFTPINVTLYLLVLIAGIVSLIPDFIIATNVEVDVFGIESGVGDYFTLFVIPVAFILFFSLTFLVKELRNSVGLKKLRSKYVLLGFVVPIVIVSILDFIFPYFGSFRLASFDSLTIFIFVGFVSYAILKYRFIDFELVLRRSFVYFISLIIIFSIYICLLILLQQFVVKLDGWSEQTVTIVLVLLIVISVEPLRRFLVNIVDKAFYAKKKSAQEEARKLRIIFSSSVQFDELISKIKGSLVNFLDVQDIQFIWLNRKTGQLENYYQEDKNVQFGSTDPVFQYLREYPEVLITDEIPYRADEQGNGERELLLAVEQSLKELDVGMVVPIGEKGELIGAFLFGYKKKKDAFTSDNVEYISRLQFQMTNAIANALLYKQAVERIGK